MSAHIIVMALALLHFAGAQSSAGFSIKHFVFGSVHGTMKIVSVEMPLQPDSGLPASVDAVIDIGSVNTSQIDRDNDLRSSEWFDVAHFPTMHFTSTRIEPSKTPNAFRVDGTLTLHGVSKDIPLDVTFSDARDDRGVRHYRYVATTKFDRRDFGVDAPKKTLRSNLFIGTSVNVRIDLDMVEAG
jgi:polyisoprenoid-binding protein YceI